MNNSLEKIKKIIQLMGFDTEIVVDEEHKKILMKIDDDLVRHNLAAILPSVDHIFNLVLRRDNQPAFIFDINYYRKERERLIVELARASARKALATKAPIELPIMNAYERRLVHMEITTHPSLTTESQGEGKERKVIIRLLE